MQTTWILYPVFAMVILTLVIAMRMLQLRFRAVMADNLNPLFFKLNRGGKPPEYMTQVEQHYVNLFESPVLFYIIAVLAYILQFVDVISVSLAWGFVFTRLVHAYIHTGSNRILQRRNIFLLSVALLVGLWSYVFIKLLLQ